MQAIQTKFLSATNYKGARIKATAEAGSIIIDYDYSLDCEDAHKLAAQALIKKFNWGGDIVGGSLAGGYVFVFKN